MDDILEQYLISVQSYRPQNETHGNSNKNLVKTNQNFHNQYSKSTIQNIKLQPTKSSHSHQHNMYADDIYSHVYFQNLFNTKIQFKKINMRKQIHINIHALHICIDICKLLMSYRARREKAKVFIPINSLFLAFGLNFSITFGYVAIKLKIFITGLSCYF